MIIYIIVLMHCIFACVSIKSANFQDVIHSMYLLIFACDFLGFLKEYEIMNTYFYEYIIGSYNESAYITLQPYNIVLHVLNIDNPGSTIYVRGSSLCLPLQLCRCLFLTTSLSLSLSLS